MRGDRDDRPARKLDHAGRPVIRSVEAGDDVVVVEPSHPVGRGHDHREDLRHVVAVPDHEIAAGGRSRAARGDHLPVGRQRPCRTERSVVVWRVPVDPVARPVGCVSLHHRGSGPRQQSARPAAADDHLARRRDRVDDVEVDAAVRALAVRVVDQVSVRVQLSLALEGNRVGPEVRHNELSGVPGNRPDVVIRRREDHLVMSPAKVLDVDGQADRVDRVVEQPDRDAGVVRGDRERRVDARAAGYRRGVARRAVDVQIVDGPVAVQVVDMRLRSADIGQLNRVVDAGPLRGGRPGDYAA